jgi:hypothetical protein
VLLKYWTLNIHHIEAFHLFEGSLNLAAQESQGLTVLDEPAAKQSDPSVLDLQVSILLNSFGRKVFRHFS